MKKILTVIFALALLFTLGVSAFAAEAEDIVDGDALTEQENAAVEDTAEGEAAVEQESAAEGENPFDAILATVKKYAAEILSALTLIGSVVLAVAYKKGLLPALGSAVGSIGASVKSVAEAAERSASSSESAISGVSEALGGLGDALDSVKSRLDSLEDELKQAEAKELDASAVKTIMRAQVDMLYDVFMTSALPQYAKDAVGERIALMKAELQEVGEDA